MAPQHTINSLQVKDLTIGEGKPKLIVSIAEKTRSAALERGRKLAAMPTVDLIEYRIDHLTDHQDPEQVAASVAEIVSAVGRKPLLMTFRTKEEGGEAAITPDAYARLYEASLQRSAPDLIDLQHALCGSAPVAAILSRAKRDRCPVVMSYHDFQATPSVETMTETLRAMQALGADIPKIAVMPHDAGDVLKLLQATWEMHSRYADRPLLTMAMGGTGVVSRISGEIFGSALTFAAVGNASAPGQMEADTLRPIVDVLGDALQQRHAA